MSTKSTPKKGNTVKQKNKRGLQSGTLFVEIVIPPFEVTKRKSTKRPYYDEWNIIKEKSDKLCKTPAQLHDGFMI